MKTKNQQLLMAIIIVIISISIIIYFIAHLRLIINVFLRPTDVLYYVKTKRPFVALTIDDGPDPEATSKILDVLQVFGVRATFFLISGNIPSNPNIVKRLVQENHEIGNHLTEDYPSIFLPRETFNRKLVEADTTLQTFKKPVLFRPANAFYRKDMILAGKKLGYHCVLGDILPLDVIITKPSIVSKYISASVRPGSIITLHDGNKYRIQTPETLKELLRYLQQKGYTVVPVTELLRIGKPMSIIDTSLQDEQAT